MKVEGMTTAIHIELNVLCLIILYAIAHQSVENVNQQMKRVLFRSLVYGIIAQLVLDSLWLLVEGRDFPGAIIANKVLNVLFLSASVVLGGIWYLYVLESLGHSMTRKLQTIVMCPSLLFVGVNILSFWTGWTFTVSAENVYAHGPHFWMQFVGAYGMLAAAGIHLIIRMIRRRIPLAGSLEGRLLSFYFIPLIGAVVSLFYTGMPGAWTCAAVSAVLLYISDQDREIIRDGLTGLNNRKTLAGVFVDYIKQAGPEKPLYLFMMDLDKFKQINDTYGHPVGDQALVHAAKLLASCMAGRRGILIRYGGDEFLIMSFMKNDGEAEAFRQVIYQKFEDYRKANNPVYHFAMSVGIARYREGQELMALVHEADQALYSEKQRRGAGR